MAPTPFAAGPAPASQPQYQVSVQECLDRHVCAYCGWLLAVWTYRVMDGGSEWCVCDTCHAQHVAGGTSAGLAA